MTFRSCITQAAKVRVITLHMQGVPGKVIAYQTGVSRPTVSRILHRFHRTIYTVFAQEIDAMLKGQPDV